MDILAFNLTAKFDCYVGDLDKYILEFFKDNGLYEFLDDDPIEGGTWGSGGTISDPDDMVDEVFIYLKPRSGAAVKKALMPLIKNGSFIKYISKKLMKNNKKIERFELIRVDYNSRFVRIRFGWTGEWW